MSIKQRSIGAISIMTGWSVAKKTLSTTRQIVVDKTAGAGFELIKESIAQLKPDRYSRSETFAEACDRQGLTTEDLAVIANGLARVAKIYRWCGYAALFAGLASSYLAPTFYWFVLYLIAGLSATALLAAYAVRYTFRLWQVETKELSSFGLFLAENGITRALAG